MFRIQEQIKSFPSDNAKLHDRMHEIDAKVVRLDLSKHDKDSFE